MFPELSHQSTETFREARRIQTLKGYKKFTCPDCAQDIWVTDRQNDTPCPNPSCYSSGVLICAKHLIRHSRVDPLNKKEPRRCLKCVEECGGDGLLASVMSSIQDAFCDRCPGCNGYVGEPQSLDFCLCLKCNHCPICFCGFCYQYAGSWNDTHVHVRHCPMNPRENYFAESEEIWRGLMRVRRQRLGEAIIAASTLSEEKKQEARRRMENLIK